EAGRLCRAGQLHDPIEGALGRHAGKREVRHVVAEPRLGCGHLNAPGVWRGCFGILRAALARGLTVWHLTLDQGVPGSNPGAPANPPVPIRNSVAPWPGLCRRRIELT